MTTPQSDIGLLKIAMEALVLLHDNLNTELDLVEQNGWIEDRYFAEAVGQSTTEVILERVDEGNFFDGHHPSFIEGPLAIFPNVSCMAYRGTPSQSQFDQFDSYDIRLFIEAIVKAGPIADDRSDQVLHETIVNRRIDRFTTAIMNVILRDRTLRGTIEPIQNPPTVAVADASMARKEEKGHGSLYLWQLSRQEYVVQRHTTFP